MKDEDDAADRLQEVFVKKHIEGYDPDVGRLFQRSGADLKPEYVHTAAMGPHNNTPYAHG